MLCLLIVQVNNRSTLIFECRHTENMKMQWKWTDDTTTSKQFPCAKDRDVAQEGKNETNVKQMSKKGGNLKCESTVSMCQESLFYMECSIRWVYVTLQPCYLDSLQRWAQILLMHINAQNMNKVSRVRESLVVISPCRGADMRHMPVECLTEQHLCQSHDTLTQCFYNICVYHCFILH